MGDCRADSSSSLANWRPVASQLASRTSANKRAGSSLMNLSSSLVAELELELCVFVSSATGHLARRASLNQRPRPGHDGASKKFRPAWRLWPEWSWPVVGVVGQSTGRLRRPTQLVNPFAFISKMAHHHSSHLRPADFKQEEAHSTQTSALFVLLCLL